MRIHKVKQVGGPVWPLCLAALPRVRHSLWGSLDRDDWHRRTTRTWPYDCRFVLHGPPELREHLAGIHERTG